MNVSFNDAVKRGWIKPEDVPRGAKQPSSVRNGKSAATRAAEVSAPAARLWAAVRHLPGAEQEYPGAIPGRKYRLDVAFPEKKLCIEVDGWEWHGKHLGDFQRDRKRQNLLTLNGWRILRFTAADLRKELPQCLEMVKTALGLEL